MKVQVYYQDFELNALSLGKEVVYKPEEAMLMTEWEVDEVSKLAGKTLHTLVEYADAIFALCNFEPYPYSPGELFRGGAQTCRDIGHTSMSIGDYVRFIDGDKEETLICASIGWRRVKTEVVFLDEPTCRPIFGEDFIAIIDQNGYECMHWHKDEWDEDPDEVWFAIAEAIYLSTHDASFFLSQPVFRDHRETCVANDVRYNEKDFIISPMRIKCYEDTRKRG